MVFLNKVSLNCGQDINSRRIINIMITWHLIVELSSEVADDLGTTQFSLSTGTLWILMSY